VNHPRFRGSRSGVVVASVIVALGAILGARHDAPAQSPANRDAAAQSPAKDDSPPKLPANRDAPAQSPAKDDSPPQSPAKRDGRAQSPPKRNAPAQSSDPAIHAPIRDERHNIRVEVKSWRELKAQNVVMQQRDYSCGAAALATIIRHHWGDNVTETGLLLVTLHMLTADEMQDRIRKGLSLTDLRRLATRVGYLATIGRLDYQKLRESKIPLLVGIVVDGYDHFVVYRGTDGYYVYLADPARGNIRIPVDVFLKQWQKNLALVVVKPGVNPNRASPLAVQPEEIGYGQWNRLYVRRQASSAPPVLPQP
jgi:predicted double-glycine peptidase